MRERATQAEQERQAASEQHEAAAAELSRVEARVAELGGVVELTSSQQTDLDCPFSQKDEAGPRDSSSSLLFSPALFPTSSPSSLIPHLPHASSTKVSAHW